MRTVGEPLSASIDALFRQVHDDQSLAQVLEERCPPSVARGDLQDRVCRHKGTDARQNGTIPLHVCAASGLRPLLPTLRPIVGLVQTERLSSIVGMSPLESMARDRQLAN